LSSPLRHKIHNTYKQPKYGQDLRAVAHFGCDDDAVPWGPAGPQPATKELLATPVRLAALWNRVPDEYLDSGPGAAAAGAGASTADGAGAGGVRGGRGQGRGRPRQGRSVAWAAGGGRLQGRDRRERDGVEKGERRDKVEERFKIKEITF
jgi:hypothetical protein